MIYEIIVKESETYSIIVKANSREKAQEIALNNSSCWRSNQDNDTDIVVIREANAGEFKGRIVHTEE